MKIEILKDGLKNGVTGESLKKGDKLSVSEDRAAKAIERGVAKEVGESKPKKSHQKKTEDKIEKK